MISKKHVYVLQAAISLSLLSACGSQPTQSGGAGTLADLNLSSRSAPTPPVQVKAATTAGAQPEKQRSKSDIKQAYYEYIQNAAKGDKLRLNAATRIAELELELAGNANTDIDEKAFIATVRKTINLLEDTLADIPNASNGDQALYQLAKAYDAVGEPEKAIATLESLVKRYPKTTYFVEAKFRIAENAFIYGNFFQSEDAYTDVLKNEGSEIFYEKALFKRGWARFKQNLYIEALDDFYDAVDKHEFAAFEKLSSGEKELFQEYFRAIGLSFSYLGGADAVSDYLSQRSDIPYVYLTYETVAKLLQKQEQYSDAAATYRAYVKQYPQGEHVVQAALSTVSLWKNTGFFNSYVKAFETFYLEYNPNAKYWRSPNARFTPEDKKSAIAAIRNHLILLAGHYHNNYLKKKTDANFKAVSVWYERYLDGYRAYARQDKVYQLYAELLNTAGQPEKALGYYEQAAFDGEIVLDKESAYAAIFLTDQLLTTKQGAAHKTLLDKHLRYAFSYAQIYPQEKQTPAIVQHAVELAFKAKQLDKVVEISNALPDTSSATVRRDVALLKAQSYFDLQQLEDAEFAYIDLLSSPGLNQKQKQDIQNKLALSIYKQGEAAQQASAFDDATRHYLRVAKEVPSSELASTGMYDAIAIFMQQEKWEDAIVYLNLFKKSFPAFPDQKDIAQKLSVAYLKSNKGIEAAKQFETLKNFASSDEEKMAAQWQAGKLYLDKKDYPSALRAFRDYAHTYKRPYAQNMEAMYIITDLYTKLGDVSKKAFWLRKISDADRKTGADRKTERTQYIAAHAAFQMAQLRLQDYEKVKLVRPLAKNLKSKKAIMQDVVKLFGQATVYGHEDFVTQSTFQIGTLYRNFARALLDSERPTNLNDDELEQYDILLEDQAFPFEDKSIEFYEVNMTRIAGGLYDSWTEKSLDALKTLYPARYNRPGLIETSFRQL